MVIPADIEIRPDTDLSPQERAEARDSFVRSFERQFADWSEIARVCCQIEQERDYLLLGFHSFGAWLIEAAPRSRSYIYLVMGRYKELAPDISDEDLARIPLESTEVLKQLSSTIRRNPELASVAIKEPKELRKHIQENHPDQHVELVVEKTIRFTASQWERVEAVYEAYLLTDEGASLATFVEWLCSEQECS